MMTDTMRTNDPYKRGYWLRIHMFPLYWAWLRCWWWLKANPVFAVAVALCFLAGWFVGGMR